jgi:GDP-4-dehydro-6-deoxy-D-mannose reductase
MTVLITGVDGFVGSHLAEAFAGRPDVRLVGTVRSLSGRPEEGSSPAEVQLDVTDHAQVRNVLLELAPQKIFHTAGQAFVPASVNDPYETFRTNIDGVVNILETVRALRAERQVSCSVLCISSGEVYGPAAADRLPITEDVPLNPANPYAVSKACADLIARQYRATFGVDVVVARPFNHLGPRQSDLFVGSAFARQIAEIRLGKREPRVLVGNTEPVRDFTDVRDVVQAYIALLEGPQPHGVFNVCSERGVAVGELLSVLRELSGVEIEVVRDPGRVRLNEIPRITGSAARLREATGWAPRIPLRRTLADLLAYWEDRLRASA